jgi:hypothetical protein
VDGLRSGVVAVLEADSDLGTILGRGQDHPVPLGGGVSQRLLEQHPNSGAEAIDRKIRVLIMRRTDVHDIGSNRVHELAMVGEARHPVARRRRCECGRFGVAYRHELGVGDCLDRFEVDDRDVAATDHCHPWHALSPSSHQR